MATAVKRGNSYKITVSCGYDVNGKQIRKHMTWTPEPGMTERQIAKELERQKILFEERCKHQTAYDGNIRLAEFTEVFMEEYARKNLKAKTLFDYTTKMEAVNQALGHIKLSDLRPGHIAAFYSNLQEEGIRKRQLATPRLDFRKLLKDRGFTFPALANSAGVSTWIPSQLVRGKKISRECAEQVAEALQERFETLFEVVKDPSPLSAGTIHCHHRVLSAVLSRAVKWGYIDKNPATLVELPSIAGRQANYLDEQDVKRLFELLKDEPVKWRTLISFAVLSGLRRGELAGLRWEDVNFADCTITIQQTGNYVPGEGIFTDTPKTRKSSRPLKLSRVAFLLLHDYKLWQEEQKEAFGDAWKDQDGRVFTSDDGAPLMPDSITTWFRKFIKRSGLPKVTLHGLRHTYASLMIADGVPLVAVSKQLGHAQPSTTANIYAHAIAAAEAKAAQTFDKFDSVILGEEETKKLAEVRAIR